VNLTIFATYKTNMEILRTQKVVKQFENHRALSDVSISVEEGTVFGLLGPMGPNGAGKTTLIRIINQITAPDEGEVFLFNEKLKSEHIKDIGYLPEERGLYKKMKVGEQAMYFAQLKGMTKSDAKSNLKSLFEKFEINDWWGKKVEEWLYEIKGHRLFFLLIIWHRLKKFATILLLLIIRIKYWTERFPILKMNLNQMNLRLYLRVILINFRQV